MELFQVQTQHLQLLRPAPTLAQPRSMQTANGCSGWMAEQTAWQMGLRRVADLESMDSDQMPERQVVGMALRMPPPCSTHSTQAMAQGHT